MFRDAYRGKRVLVTGHTGFKGSWLTAWLLKLGADVAGYSIDIPTSPSNFEAMGLGEHIKDYRGDIRDRELLAEVMNDFKPDVVFHLAAQPIVRLSYDEPVETFEVNVLGTMNVLEVVRHSPFVQACIVITSDKCYRNVEWIWGYRENDMLGGEDPYSASKGCAELVSYSYIHSFFAQDDAVAKVSTARAGNVIGGGDWALDRIVPDCFRSWSEGREVMIRSPYSTRPWQHVLEPLSGYLWLGAHMLEGNASTCYESYNFGPDASVNQPVEVLIRELGKGWEKAKFQVDPAALKGKAEARLLKLSCDKALADLSWQAVMRFDETVEMTSHWYQAYYNGQEADMFEYTMQQLDAYCEKALARGQEWAQA